MKQYLELLSHVLEQGVDRGDRTGTGTRSVFGHQMRFDLSQGFPLLTTKKLHIRSIIHELLWFIQGDTNIVSSKVHCHTDIAILAVVISVINSLVINCQRQSATRDGDISAPEKRSSVDCLDASS